MSLRDESTDSGPVWGFLGDAGRTIVPRRGDRHGPLPPILLLLTLVTGIVDAISFLSLGHVFVANMTGNVVFLGFGVAGEASLSVPSSLAAIATFLIGAAVAGRSFCRFVDNRGRLVAYVTSVEAGLIAVALIAALLAPSIESVHYVLIVLLSLAMGFKNAMARTLAVPEMKITVLTLTITGLAADAASGGGLKAMPGRRILAVLTMFIGAFVGGLLTLHVAVTAALALALLLTVISAVASYYLSRSQPSWTRPVS